MIAVHIMAILYFTHLYCTLHTMRNLVIYSNQWLVMMKGNGVSDPIPTIWQLCLCFHGNCLKFLNFDNFFVIYTQKYPILHSFRYLALVCKKIVF